MDSFFYVLVICLCVNVPVFCNQLELALQQFNLVSYSRCRIDEDCLNISNNSFCFDNDADKIGKCKCRDGFELVSRNRTFFACLGPAGYGEPCEKNMQCQLTLTENAECANSVCRCRDNAHLFTDGRCYISVLLGDFCRSDGNCWMAGNTFGNCRFGQCTCKFDREVPNEDKVSCVIGRNMGELCDSDAECALTPNTQCRVNCRCAAGFALSRDQTRCLRAATQFSDPCEENDQCSAFLTSSICLSNNCTCAEGYHGFGSRCVRSASPGSFCTSTEECIPESRYSDIVSCIDGACKCLKDSEMLGCNSKADIFRVSLLFIVFHFIFCKIL